MPGKKRNNQKNSRRQKIIRRGHRWVGYSALFFIFILSITGLALNHTDKLDLNQIRINNGAILAFYNLPTPKEVPINFKRDKIWLSWLEGRLYLNGRFFAKNDARPLGFARQGKLIIIGSQTHLSLYLIDGSLIEILDSSSLPGKILRFGQSANGGILITTPAGNYTSNSDFLSWKKLPADFSFTSEPVLQAPDKIKKKILQNFRGPGISLYRLVLDLHSGRILGFFGPYLMDLAAIGLIILGLTGLMQRKRTTKEKQKKK